MLADKANSFWSSVAGKEQVKLETSADSARKNKLFFSSTIRLN